MLSPLNRIDPHHSRVGVWKRKESLHNQIQTWEATQKRQRVLTIFRTERKNNKIGWFLPQNKTFKKVPLFQPDNHPNLRAGGYRSRCLFPTMHCELLWQIHTERPRQKLQESFKGIKSIQVSSSWIGDPEGGVPTTSHLSNFSMPALS